MVKSVLKWLAIGLGVILSLWIAYGAVLYFRVKDLYTISSDSMAPALISGDVIRVDRDAYRTRKPEPGEIVLFNPTDGPQQPFLFRIVGVPGDRVIFPKGKLFVNEKPVEARPTEKTPEWEMYEEKLGSRTFLVTYTTGATSFFETPALMGENEYFVAGDNRDNARDSRYLGPVKAERIVGRAVKIVDSKDPKRIGKDL